jgi:hypothetical protein
LGAVPFDSRMTSESRVDCDALRKDWDTNKLNVAGINHQSSPKIRRLIQLALLSWQTSSIPESRYGAFKALDQAKSVTMVKEAVGTATFVRCRRLWRFGSDILLQRFLDNALPPPLCAWLDLVACRGQDGASPSLSPSPRPANL